VYAVVNTPYAGIRASAICAFSIEDIAHLFSNSVFFSRLPAGQRPTEPNERASQCVADSKSLSEEAVAFAVTHPLLQDAVSSFFERPLIVHTDGR
jgi:semaphorin 6